MKPSDQAQWQVSVDSWLAQGCVYGTVTDPVTGSTIADSGQLVAGYYNLKFLITSDTADTPVVILHRNAANNGNLYTGYLRSIIGIAPVISIPNWKVAENERIRIDKWGAALGFYSVTIWWTKRA